MTLGKPAVPELRTLSFRDPAGELFQIEDRVLRRVSAAHAPVLREFLRSQAANELVAAQNLIATRIVPRRAWFFNADQLVVEHDRVWFPSYPHEWPVEMLRTAGQLTLELAQAVLPEGFGLKDATPYNVLFRGPKPVFVDVLSFENRTPGDPTWLPYAQFERMFVLPLLLHELFGVRTGEIFLEHRDGIEPEDVYRRTSWGQRLRPALLTSVSLPTWLSNRAKQSGTALYRQKLVAPEQADFILRTHFRRLEKRLARGADSPGRCSRWSSYMQELGYSDAEFNCKADTVERWLAELRPRTVLDVGCNTGHFSEIAARQGARVVAIDSDPAVVGRTWRRAARARLDILPLTVNIARPTPAMGWRNAEHSSFLGRATGAFELVTMLAIVHHLLVSERVPLPEILSLTAALTTGYAIVEYVAPHDPMFQRMTRGREALHVDFSQEALERTCSRQFTVLKKQPLKADLRCLYLLQKRAC